MSVEEAKRMTEDTRKGVHREEQTHGPSNVVDRYDTETRIEISDRMPHGRAGEGLYEERDWA